MPLPAPATLPENEGLAFRGERIPASARLTARAAEKLIAVRNPNGRPNADVVRRMATWSRGSMREHWLVAFPPHMDAQEAALYVEPAKLRHGTVSPDRALRNALARRERYLASPAGAATPAWDWLDATVIPDDTLVVVARDDDYSHGVLSARPFALWWRQFHTVASYPFPWSPAKGLSDLTAAQEEQRHTIARAARSGSGGALEDAVAAAYGWPGDLSDDDMLSRLIALNRCRKV